MHRFIRANSQEHGSQNSVVRAPSKQVPRRVVGSFVCFRLHAVKHWAMEAVVHPITYMRAMFIA